MKLLIVLSWWLFLVMTPKSELPSVNTGGDTKAKCEAIKAQVDKEFRPYKSACIEFTP